MANFSGKNWIARSGPEGSRARKPMRSAKKLSKWSPHIKKLRNLTKFQVITSVLVVLTLVLQIQLWFGSANFLNIWRLHEAIVERQKINQEWQTKNQHLAASINNLKTGANVVEAQARMNLGMIKSGELYYQVVGS